MCRNAMGDLLCQAARFNDSHRLRELLETNEATPNVCCHHCGPGHTPAHWAAWYGSVECLQLLLDHGLDPNTFNNFNQTPAHLAAERGFTDVLHMLASYGACFQTKDWEGRCPKQVALSQHNFNVAQYIERITGDRGADYDRGTDYTKKSAGRAKQMILG